MDVQTQLRLITLVKQYKMMEVVVIFLAVPTLIQLTMTLQLALTMDHVFLLFWDVIILMQLILIPMRIPWKQEEVS